MNFMAVFVIICFFEQIIGSGRLSLKLLSYNNPSHRLSDGSCCEGAVCSSECDNYFKICLTRPSKDRCSLGYKKTSVLGDDSFNFGSSLSGGTGNPVLYGFPKWEGSFGLTIEIYDKDGGLWGSDDFVDRYDRNLVISAHEKESRAKTVKFNLRGRVSRMDIEIRVFCDDKYLLPTCEEYCVYTDNDRGHYDCDYARGKKICLDGWYGPRCLQKRKDCTPRDDKNGHFVCDPITGDIICRPGWKDEKLNCTEEIDECSSNPCLNSGRCWDLVNDYNCSCKAGYEGKNCGKDINECLSSPCVYGTCNNLLNRYTCNCRAGFQGKHCESEIDECTSNPCSHGSCINAINAFKCICDGGYTGNQCEQEINECLSQPCKNNGICGDLINAYNCTCKSGFYGRHCDSTVNKELHQTTTVFSSTKRTLQTKPSILIGVLSTQKLEDKVLPTISFTASSFASNTRRLASEERLSSVNNIHSSVIDSALTIDNVAMATSTENLITDISKWEDSESRQTEINFKETSVTFAVPTSREQKLSSDGGKTPEVSSSVFGTEKRATYKKFDFRFQIELQGDVRKWNQERCQIFKREICSQVYHLCAKYSIECGKGNNQGSPTTTTLQTIRRLKSNSSIIITESFTLNVTGDREKTEASDCVHRAITTTGTTIEKKTSFKLVRVKLLKEDISSMLLHLTPSSSLHASKTVGNNGDMDPAGTNSIGTKLDRSKMLALLVVSHIIIITLILFVIQWIRKQRSSRKVSPVSKQQFKHNNNEESCRAKERFLDNGTSRSTELVEKKLIKPPETMFNSTNIDKKSLLEKETIQLETLFL